MEGNQLISRIEAGFSNVLRPEKERITRCSCWECQEIRDEFGAHDPEDLDPERMRYHAWDMTFFSPEARQYFLPRWMALGVRMPDMAYADASIQTLGYNRGWDVPGGYTVDQGQAILAFLDFIRQRNGDRCDEDLEEALSQWPDPDEHCGNEESL